MKSNYLIKMIMDYYCGVCDEIIKHKSNETILKNHI